jgi:hypothetical protein
MRWWFAFFELKNPRMMPSKVILPVGYWYLTPVILATWMAEIRRIKVRGQPG